MNRRGYLKGMLAIVGSGIVSVTAVKWIKSDSVFEFSMLEKKKMMLAELVEVIIPTTDTPGAKICGVHDYIIAVLRDCYEEKQQRNFLNGMEDLEKYSLDNYGTSFINCSSTEKNSILKNLADNTGLGFNILNKVRKKVLGEPFFTQLRNLTVEGYCLSKRGATEGLAYDYIPGSFQACIPLQANQKSWATK